MGRGCAFIIIGFGAIVMISWVRADAFKPPPLIASIALFLAALGAAASVGGRGLVRWINDRKREAAARREGIDLNTARRLMGDYSPYVIEAAQELGETRNSAAVPLLVREIGRLMSERPPGWLEMAVAMAEALGQIGDPSCLPVLHALRMVEGSDFMTRWNALPRLEEIINSLERSSAALAKGSKLLRPAGSKDEDLLRLPGLTADGGNLLRPDGD